MTESAWQRLGDLTKQRREELGLTQQQIQGRGGPSTASLRRLENGRATSMDRGKRRDLERALDWRIGSIDDILEGGDPAPASEAVEIPNLTATTTPDGVTRYEVKELGAFDGFKLYGAATAAATLLGAANDLEDGEGSQERVILWARRTHDRVMEILADVMRTDVVQAALAARHLAYAIDDPAATDRPQV